MKWWAARRFNMLDVFWMNFTSITLYKGELGFAIGVIFIGAMCSVWLELHVKRNTPP